ncbi:AAA family ATPase [Arcobacter vandammei]|uniref:AAA family ATPase n=1 Tax=Arcobacter vandammei TaxID=2782243 RepID=UPI0018DFF528|nr:ATP-binding protein [Arcobacter vandammei]
MYSPFPYDRLPSKDEFFGRTTELENLSQIVDYSNNALIYSKRRMGKSSLIKALFNKYEDNYICLYSDIFDITSKEDFISNLLKALANYNSKKFDIKGAIKNLTSLFKRVRFEPSIDTNTLEYSIKPNITSLSFEEMMDEFFSSLDELSKKSKVVLAIDEFQQIANITDVKLDAILRKYIQNRSNISYIFLGSKRHMLTSLFEYKAPLYEMANHIELKALKLEDVFNYATKHIDIRFEMCEYIYSLSDGETKLIQQILHILFIKKEKVDEKEQINIVLKEIIGSKDSSYRLLFDTLGNNQKIALKIVGKYKSGIFSQSVLEEFNIKKQTLQSSVEALFKQELIDKNDDKYFIPDRVFELWVEGI